MYSTTVGSNVVEVRHFCIEDKMGQHPTEMYAGGLDLQTLTDKLNRVAPLCSGCGYPMTDICVEQCCSGQMVFCWDCHQGRHFLHRTNDMRVLFLSDKLLYKKQER